MSAELARLSGYRTQTPESVTRQLIRRLDNTCSHVYRFKVNLLRETIHTLCPIRKGPCHVNISC